MRPDHFNYVIARPWEPQNPDSRLAVYMLMSREIQEGSAEDARLSLDYVRRQVRRERGEDPKHYAIYKVTLEKLA